MQITQEAYLEHHGVKGMHWGVRQSKSKTGLSRARGATIDRNNRHIKTINDIKDGHAFRVSAFLDRVFNGKSNQTRNLNVQIKNLNAQNSRIKSGKLEVHDRLSVIGGTSLAGLFVSVTPKPPRKLTVPSNATAHTKRAVHDHNTLSDREFLRKYAVSKSRYASRIDRSGGHPERTRVAKLSKKVNSSGAAPYLRRTKVLSVKGASNKDVRTGKSF